MISYHTMIFFLIQDFLKCHWGFGQKEKVNILTLNCRAILKLLVTLFHILIPLDCTIKFLNSGYENFSHNFLFRVL